MRTLIIIFGLLISSAAFSQVAEEEVLGEILICENEGILRIVLDKVISKPQNFSDYQFSEDDYKEKEKVIRESFCAFREVKKGNGNVTLVSHYKSKATKYEGEYTGLGQPGFIFTLHQIVYRESISGAMVERYFANGIYNPKYWRIAKGRKACGKNNHTGTCLVSTGCSAVEEQRNVTFYTHLPLPSSIEGVREAKRCANEHSFKL